MLTNHTVNVNGHAGVRWYEMRKEEDGDWYMYQQGTYSPDNDNRWMGSIAMNGEGEIALGYTVSSSSVYPSVRYTGRSPEAPLGEMNYIERELVEGTSSQSGINRWGDYSCMSVDPSDDYTFWYTQEYMRGGWKTRIGQFDFGPVLPPQISVGNDTTYCENNLFVAKANAIYSKSIFWESDGDGTFIPAPPVNLIQGYIRGAEDILNGGFNLNVTAYGFEQGMIDYDTINVTLIRLPKANAGNDTIVPQYASVLLNASAEDYTSLEWSTNGDGIFDDNTILNSTYTPGPNDIEGGEVELTLTVYPVTPCDEEDSDKVKVTLDPTIGFRENGVDELTLEIVPNPSKGEFKLFANDPTMKNAILKIYNQLGEVIFEELIKDSGTSLSKQFNLSYLPRGLYFVGIKTTENYKVEKVIIQ
jgi:hypothetical protein